MPAPPFPRADTPTPALMLDQAALDRNIARMAAFAAGRGIQLRPHAKTHKSSDIGRRQIAAGAVGLCCAKLGEAEAFAGEGLTRLHLTSPVVAPGAIARLAALNGRAEGLSVVADHPENVRRLNAANAGGARPLTVLIDVDPGNRRTGVASAEAALALAREIAACGNLRLGGVQYYCGAQQHIQSFEERRAAIVERTDYLGTLLQALRAAGFAIQVVTGGGTGSFMIDAALGVLTELQVGSYLFLDREYGECELAAGGAPVFEPSLFVDATVISANAAGLVTVDAGLKAISADAGPPDVAGTLAPDAHYLFMGDEHGAIVSAQGPLPKLGDRVTLLPGHCDPTVNLHDLYHVHDGDMVVEIWPVTGRGRST
ncbi:MAG TPA: DSD1 family PLP-dependent enzyme [Allosphingosinicella sp.]|jgi:D-serine deaminase-like pyridoxal phosphate-dependent protein|nr:DSD1 family PLP-dependent enzyme [Allosphingosinicella sp.]